MNKNERKEYRGRAAEMLLRTNDTFSNSIELDVNIVHQMPVKRGVFCSVLHGLVPGRASVLFPWKYRVVPLGEGSIP